MTLMVDLVLLQKDACSSSFEQFCRQPILSIMLQFGDEFCLLKCRTPNVCIVLDLDEFSTKKICIT